MNNEELLKYAIEHDMINMSCIEEQINMNKRKELLEKHPYKIWEGSDGKYHTYLPDEAKKRVLRKRNTQKEIEDLIIEFWKEKQENPTIKEIFNEWIEFKRLHNIQNQTVDRYRRDFNTYFSDIKDKKIKSVDECDLNDFLVDIVFSHNMTAKAFSNVRILVRGIWIRAKKKKLIDFRVNEVLEELEISKKDFAKPEIKEEVYTDEERERMIGYLENNLDLINLGLLLIFATGIRVGELSALRTEDIFNNKICISRTEISYELKRGKYTYEVRDFPKTEAGIREIYISNEFKKYLAVLKRWAFGREWAFEKNKKRIRTYQFQSRLRYICTKKLKMKVKSPHKIRKTYASLLVDSGIPENIIISQMGHTDIRTTKKHYYRNHYNGEDVEKIVSDLNVL